MSINGVETAADEIQRVTAYFNADPATQAQMRQEAMAKDQWRREVAERMAEIALSNDAADY